MKKTEKKTVTVSNPDDHTFAGLLATITSNAVSHDARQTLPDGKEIVSRSYVLENSKGKKTELQIFDADLILSMDKINASRAGASLMSYVVCKELSKIAKIDLKGYGFKDCAEFARHVWGYSPNTVNQYIRIGENLIDDTYKPIVGLPSTLPIAHMIELLSYGTVNGAFDKSRIQQLYLDGTLKDGMTAKQIRTALKNPALEEHKEEKKGGRKPKEHNPIEIATTEELDALSNEELEKGLYTAILFIESNLSKLEKDSAKSVIERIKTVLSEFEESDDSDDSDESDN